MAPTRAFYSVVQYVPDPGRAEGANAGVVLYVPGTSWVRVKPSPSLERVKKFFKPTDDDLARIGQALSGLRHRLEKVETFDSEKDLARFASSRPDAVRLTQPRLVMVGDPATDLDKLYEELVGDPDLKTPRAKPGRALPPLLASVVERLKVDGRVWLPRKINVPEAMKKFEVAAAYRNGVVNYVRPEPLTGEKVKNRLPQLGFNGQLIARHGVDGEQSKLVVVSADPAVKPGIEQRFRDALDEFGVRFVPFAEADQYAAEVERTAH